MIIILISYVLIGAFSGGRSSFISIIYSFGLFIYFYYSQFPRNKLKYFNYISCIMIFFGIFIMLYVTSQFSGFSFNETLRVILNRILANGDGLYYYMKFDGINIESGIIPYFMSFAGIYIKRFSNIDYKNIGHQLSELAVSSDLSFAQGANYTIFTQVMVLGYFSALVYIILLTYVTSRFRRLRPTILSLKQFYFRYYV